MIYLDNNATTALDPAVLKVVAEELSAGPANPSSVHQFGQRARARLADARRTVAAYFNARPQEIVFTSGATESLNWLIRSLAKGKRVLSSPLEHAAVYNVLEKMPTQWAMPNVAEPDDSIGLMVFMSVNNETGERTDIERLAHIAKMRNIPLIVDGVAQVGKEAVHIPDGVTAYVFSGHKFHAPKGTGGVVLKGPATPLLVGGPQEAGRRAGTENLAGIVGMARALELIEPAHFDQMRSLRDHFEARVRAALPSVRINGTNRTSNVSNLAFPGVDGETLLFALDRAGLACSFGSACSSGTLSVSRVLAAMGVKDASLRFSLSRFTTLAHVDEAVDILLANAVV